MALLLFDIDGTLLNTHGCGRDAGNDTFEKHFGCKNALKNIPLMGRTDTYIWKQACLNCNISQKTYNKIKKQVLQDYYDFLKKRLLSNSKACLCPGIKEILLKIKNRHKLGLLTGNFKTSGMIKIAHFSLDKYFPVGGFGDDNENRNHIAHLTIKRAQKFYKKQFKPEEIYIIGDTPFDIECAKNTGTISVAVATGSFQYDELKKYSPDYLFYSFKDPEKILKILNN